jgi:hypothetical protein
MDHRDMIWNLFNMLTLSEKNRARALLISINLFNRPTAPWKCGPYQIGKVGEEQRKLQPMYVYPKHIVSQI